MVADVNVISRHITEEGKREMYKPEICLKRQK
jgi:hypothetical protein